MPPEFWKKMSPHITYYLRAVAAESKENASYDPTTFMPFLNAEKQERYITHSDNPNFEDCIPDEDDAADYLLEEDEINLFNDRVLDSASWMALMALYDQDEDRAKGRAEQQARKEKNEKMWKTPPEDLLQFHLRGLGGDENCEDDDAEEFPVAPAPTQQYTAEMLSTLEDWVSEDQNDAMPVWDFANTTAVEIHRFVISVFFST